MKAVTVTLSITATITLDHAANDHAAKEGAISRAATALWGAGFVNIATPAR